MNVFISYLNNIFNVNLKYHKSIYKIFHIKRDLKPKDSVIKLLKIFFYLT